MVKPALPFAIVEIAVVGRPRIRKIRPHPKIVRRRVSERRRRRAPRPVPPPITVRPWGPEEPGKPTPLPAMRVPEAAGAVPMQVLRRRHVTSTWVKTLYLIMYAGQPRLAIRFKDNYTCLYPNTNSRDYDYAVAAASKGRHVWAALYTRNKIPVVV